MAEPVRNIGVMFGGVSPEHEVSVISSLQAAAALDRALYNPIPIYVAKDGTWYTGAELLDPDRYKDLEALLAQALPVHLVPGSTGRLQLIEATQGLLSKPQRFEVDVVFLGFHGGEGENGGMQGLFETFNVPYTGSSVFGSALGMDKVQSKFVCRDQGIPVVEFVAFRESEWAGREESWLDECEETLGYPVIVKPARLGSSIGIVRAVDRKSLDDAIEDAFRYDEKVIVEYAVRKLREVNCSILGDPNEAIPSVLEEPVRTDEEATLSFEDKYLRGGSEGTKGERPRRPKAGDADAQGMASLDRIIPARLSPERTEEIRSLAVRIFKLFECAGVARIDFMIEQTTDRVFFNEINTIPGSFSFYLWEPTGVPFDRLTHRMIEVAIERHRQKNGRVRSYETNLLSLKSLTGLKGKA